MRAPTTFLFAFLAMAISGAASAEIVYFCDAGGNVGQIDSGTLVASPVGTLSGFSISQVLGLAYDPVRDALLILDRNGTATVYTMDPATGVASVLFNPGFSFQGGAVLGDEVYGIDESTQTIRSFSLTTFALTTGSAAMAHTHGMGINQQTGQLYARNSNQEIYEVTAARVAGAVILSGTGGVEDIDPLGADFVGVDYGRELNLIDGVTGVESVLMDTTALAAVGVTGSMSGVATRQLGLGITSTDTMPTAVAPGQAGIAVTMDVLNSTGDALDVTRLALTFADSMAVDVSMDYTVTPDPANPTSIPAMGSQVFQFFVDVATNPTVDTITIDGEVDAIEPIAMTMHSAAGAMTTDSWDVIGALPMVRTVFTAPAMVSQGSTGHQVTVDVENVGLSEMTVATVGLTFTGTLDRTAQYVVTPDPGNPTTIASGATEVFLLTVDVDPMATTELVVIDGTCDGTTTLSGAAVSDPDADTTDSWIVEACGATLCGDCNGDLTITILDALVAAQHAAGLITLMGVDFTNCNVIGAVEPSPGAMVDILDALTLAQSAAGLPVMLVCC